MLPSPRRLLVLTGVLWIPLLLWWFALLPGGMSNDSFNSWAQIKGQLHWASHHPPPFTAMFWLTSLGGTTPATASLAQTLMMAFALAFFATAVGVALRSTRAVWICAGVLALAPLVGPFAVTIWKDIPETAALLGLAGLLVLGWRHAARERGAAPLTRSGGGGRRPRPSQPPRHRRLSRPLPTRTRPGSRRGRVNSRARAWPHPDRQGSSTPGAAR